MQLHITKNVTNGDDNQPCHLLDGTDTNDSVLMKLPKTSALELPHEVLSRRNQKVILMYQKPDKYTYPEKYARSLLLLFYPFKN